MTDTILVPIDGSRLSIDILPVVTRLLRGRDIQLSVLEVYAPNGDVHHAGHPSNGEPALRGELRAALEGTHFRVRFRVGDPAHEILEAAARERPFLVAMSTHGRGGAIRLVRGSVAERVLRLCPAPLLLANPKVVRADPERPFRSALVPLDGSEQADGILPLVEAIARPAGIEVQLLRVETLEPEGAAHVLGPRTPSDAREALASLEPQRARLVDAGLRAGAQVAYGDPALRILEAATDKDLVFLSTHGRSGPSRWWFGSVAEKVLRACDRPLVVRRMPPASEHSSG